MKTVIGKYICSYYALHNCLNDSNKNELANLIVQAESDKVGGGMSTTAVRFIALASAICHLFPNEKECVYYDTVEITIKLKFACGDNGYNLLLKTNFLIRL